MSDILGFKDLTINADKAVFNLRELEKGTWSSDGERAAIRSIADKLQYSVDETIPRLMAAERDLAERTDRDGTIYPTAYDLRAAHMQKRKGKAPYDQLSVAGAKAKVDEAKSTGDYSKLSDRDVLDASLPLIEAADWTIQNFPGSVTVLVVDKSGNTTVPVIYARGQDLLGTRGSGGHGAICSVVMPARFVEGWRIDVTVCPAKPAAGHGAAQPSSSSR